MFQVSQQRREIIGWAESLAEIAKSVAEREKATEKQRKRERDKEEHNVPPSSSLNTER